MRVLRTCVPLTMLVLWFAPAHAADSADDGQGYQEIMARDAADPKDAPVDNQPFTTVQLTILASEITDGANGPRLPVSLAYSNDGRDANLRQFSGGKAVTIGATENTAFTGSISGFRLVASCRDHTIASDDLNCMVLRNHDHLQSFMTRHLIQQPFGDQLAISAILRPFLDAHGDVVLKDTQRIALFELGSRDPANPAYDFQDLVVLVDLSKPMPFHRGDF